MQAQPQHGNKKSETGRKVTRSGTDTEISKTGLNVIGERHVKSRDRRDFERIFAEDLNGLEYKGEDQLRGIVKNKEVNGDNFVLRARYALSKALESLSKLYDSYNPNLLQKPWTSKAKEEANQYKNFYWDNYRYMLEGALSDIKRSPGSQLDEPKREQLKKDLGNQLGWVKGVWGGSNWDNKETVNKQLKTWGQTLQKSYHDIGGDEKRKVDYSQARSYHMHDIANQLSSEKVMWMVGQNHVDDIAEMQAERTYTLINDKEFNKIFKAAGYVEGKKENDALNDEAGKLDPLSPEFRETMGRDWDLFIPKKEKKR